MKLVACVFWGPKKAVSETVKLGDLAWRIEDVGDLPPLWGAQGGWWLDYGWWAGAADGDGSKVRSRRKISGTLLVRNGGPHTPTPLLTT